MSCELFCLKSFKETENTLSKQNPFSFLFAKNSDEIQFWYWLNWISSSLNDFSFYRVCTTCLIFNLFYCWIHFDEYWFQSLCSITPQNDFFDFQVLIPTAAIANLLLCCHQTTRFNVTAELFSFTNPVLGHPLILLSMLDLLLTYSAELRSSLVFVTETMTTPSLIANVNCKDLNSPMVEQTHGRIRAAVAWCMMLISSCGNLDVECQELPLWLWMNCNEGTLRNAREKPLGLAESVKRNDVTKKNGVNFYSTLFRTNSYDFAAQISFRSNILFFVRFRTYAGANAFKFHFRTYFHSCKN